ncbi:2-amino-4-hydroxy-6-hydroxymethyldihydropteridine diphosphokinase [Helicobacter sp. 16-1353]|uniref:2-amino-4-hydroxy-6- hydroxymethyldihydropteridine diphosphokinase n=1 Tax=Helicobacter sp. 16-1353 TaxID=2004996 RepID=UPI000DCE3FDF|nr:2-amino-4-hydroxy-6-hydroxymethyldihydropteridine diphosphokinase [Helicobacter sp. 16-1353]RAX53134.1 2-amino-4-hydroxy-6-hydroxymethyldihydropteridine diphosphokinase [Helicobacter sp. 16-1353]
MREIICHSFFPMKQTNRLYLQNTSILSLGGNLKNPIKTFINLFRSLQNNRNIVLVSTSPIYKNPPFGYTNQNDFYNATMILTTNMCLIEFYRFVFYLERIFGRKRKRKFKNAPRILDIDILFFNDIFFRSSKLNIPHPHWQERESVLIPLLYQVNYKGN